MKFDDIKFDDKETVEIAGVALKRGIWLDNFRMLKLSTAAADLTIKEAVTGFELEAGAPQRIRFEQHFKSLEEAVIAAASFDWTKRIAAGVEFVLAAPIGDYEHWGARLTERDRIDIWRVTAGDGGFLAERKINTDAGHIRIDSYRESHQPHTFEEAVAEMFNLPTMILALATTHQSAIQSQSKAAAAA